MLNQQIYSNIECAFEHQCAKKKDNLNKCAFCEVGYSFIACEPILLQCKHHVCKECSTKVEKGGLKCKFCSVEMKTNMHNPASEAIIQLFLANLSQNLRDKYVEALNLFERSKVKPFDLVSKEKQKAKDQIDMKVEELKKELEKMREQLHKEVDYIGDKALERFKEEESDLTFKEQAKQLESLLKKGNLELNKFYEYQKSLKDILEKTQLSYTFKFEMDFKPSVNHFNYRRILGKINFNNAVFNQVLEKVNKDKLGYYRIPKNIRLTLEGHSDRVRSLTVLPNGDLVSGSDDKTIKMWYSFDGTLKKTTHAHDGTVRALVALKNGHFVSGSDDKTIKIWNNQGKIVKTIIVHSDGVTCLALLENDAFASVSKDKSIKIWSANGDFKKVLIARIETVFRLAVFPNGDLASASDDKTVKIWVLDGKYKRSLMGHTSFVLALAVLLNGNLASGSHDKTIKIWKRAAFEYICISHICGVFSCRASKW